MKKEEFKRCILKMLNQKDSLIDKLLLEENLYDSCRTYKYAERGIYLHSQLNLILDFQIVGYNNEFPVITVQFHDGLTIPREWGIQALGDFADGKSMIGYTMEEMFIENDYIKFRHRQISISFDEYLEEMSLTGSEGIHRTYSLNMGRYGFIDMNSYTLGRAKNNRKCPIFIDYKMDEDEYNRLLTQLMSWVQRNKLGYKENAQVVKFLDYCYKCKGTKSKSPLRKIQDYLSDGKLTTIA